MNGRQNDAVAVSPAFADLRDPTANRAEPQTHPFL